MSLLLDALNKADEERKRNENPPSIGSNHDTSLAMSGSGNKIPVFAIAASIGVILAILLVVVYWWGRHTLVVNTTSETVSSQTSTNTHTTTTSKTIGRTKPAPVNAAPVENQANTATDYSRKEHNTATTQDAPPEESVASLYQQNTNNVAPAIQPTKTIATTARTEVNAPPAKQEAPNPQVVSSIKQFSNLPEIHDLPNNVLERIPSLNYTEHHYNSNGGNVVINGSVRHVNDQLASGLVIDKILEDGMILHIDTYSFKMRALNSWVNM